ncbi:WD40-repeat-containing domain [Pseudocohnilembus persalinus]|uniref:WD40-repeat-containing domain n=1 Tax=Pseudocohnilembus persalinus TaxID=266149 RepID=A0A0V0QGP3_PSEPJ|nr:WD40-repeat-containing domain [Pseudocohnilembus persalinus]|eukprot:KRX01324.1 WD40-repeat-containing domain [Pseudocohnilembus persalinus]
MGNACYRVQQYQDIQRSTILLSSQAQLPNFNEELNQALDVQIISQNQSINNKNKDNYKDQKKVENKDQLYNLEIQQRLKQSEKSDDIININNYGTTQVQQGLNTQIQESEENEYFLIDKQVKFMIFYTENIKVFTHKDLLKRQMAPIFQEFLKKIQSDIVLPHHKFKDDYLQETLQKDTYQDIIVEEEDDYAKKQSEDYEKLVEDTPENPNQGNQQSQNLQHDAHHQNQSIQHAINELQKSRKSLNTSKIKNNMINRDNSFSIEAISNLIESNFTLESKLIQQNQIQLIPQNSNLEYSIGNYIQGIKSNIHYIINLKEKKLYCVKIFHKNQVQDYIEERDKYLILEDKFGRSFQVYGVMMESFNDEKLSIYFKQGLCSLDAFVKKRCELNVRWGKDELIYIFMYLINFVFFMYENNYFHGDLKPQNIILEYLSDLNESNVDFEPQQTERIVNEQLQLKIIDFSGATDNFESQQSFTPLYFNNYNNVQKLVHFTPFFKSKNDRLKNEIYTVLRVFQSICVYGQQDENIIYKFKLKTGYIFQTKENLISVNESIKQEIFPDYYNNCPDFKILLDFMTDKLITFNYEIKDIEELLIKLKPKQSKAYSMAAKTQQGNNSKENQFSVEGQQNKNNVLLINQGIIDNDLVCEKIIQDMIRHRQKINRKILTEQIVDPIQQLLITECYITDIQYWGTQNLDLSKNIFDCCFDSKETCQSKIIITGRTQLFQKQKSQKESSSSSSSQDKKFKQQQKNKQSLDFSVNITQFQKQVTYYLCPFTNEQIDQFIRRFLEAVRQRYHYYQIQCFETDQKYYQLFAQNPELYELSKNPLILRIILEMLPQMEKRIQKNIEMEQLEGNEFSEANTNKLRSRQNTAQQKQRLQNKNQNTQSPKNKNNNVNIELENQNQIQNQNGDINKRGFNFPKNEKNSTLDSYEIQRKKVFQQFFIYREFTEYWIRHKIQELSPRELYDLHYIGQLLVFQEGQEKNEKDIEIMFERSSLFNQKKGDKFKQKNQNQNEKKQEKQKNDDNIVNECFEILIIFYLKLTRIVFLDFDQQIFAEDEVLFKIFEVPLENQQKIFKNFHLKKETLEYNGKNKNQKYISWDDIKRVNFFYMIPVQMVGQNRFSFMPKSIYDFTTTVLFLQDLMVLSKHFLDKDQFEFIKQIDKSSTNSLIIDFHGLNSINYLNSLKKQNNEISQQQSQGQNNIFDQEKDGLLDKMEQKGDRNQLLNRKDDLIQEKNKKILEEKSIKIEKMLDLINIKEFEQLTITRKLLQMKDWKIMQQICEYFKCHQKGHLQMILLQIILMTRVENENKEKIFILASNCATIYNILKFYFSGLDLSGVILRGAKMRKGIFLKTNFQNADLSNCDFSNAQIIETDFRGANLQNVYFGKLPLYKNHKAPILFLSQSEANENLIASASKDGEIQIWSSASHEIKYRNKVQNYTITSLQFSPQQQILFISYENPDNKHSMPKLVAIKNYKNQDQTKILELKENRFSQVYGQLPMSKLERILKPSIQQQSYLPSLQGNQEHLKMVQEQIEQIYCQQMKQMAISINGKFLACISQYGTEIFKFKQQIYYGFKDQEKQNQKEKFMSMFEENFLLTEACGTHVDFCLSEDYIVVAGGKGSNQVKIFSIIQKKIVKQISEFNNSFGMVQFSPSGQELVGIFEGTNRQKQVSYYLIKIWDIQEGVTKKKLLGLDSIITTFQFTKQDDGQYIVAGDYEGRIILWNVLTSEPIEIFQQHQGCINALLFSQNDINLFTGSADTLIKQDYLQQILQKQKQQSLNMKVYDLERGPEDNITCLSQFQDNNIIVGVQESVQSLVYNLDSGKQVQNIQNPSQARHRVNCIAYSQKFDKLIILDEEKMIVYQASTNQPLFLISVMHFDKSFNVSVNPIFPFFAYVEQENQIYICYFEDDIFKDKKQFQKSFANLRATMENCKQQMDFNENDFLSDINRFQEEHYIQLEKQQEKIQKLPYKTPLFKIQLDIQNLSRVNFSSCGNYLLSYNSSEQNLFSAYKQQTIYMKQVSKGQQMLGQQNYEPKIEQYSVRVWDFEKIVTRQKSFFSQICKRFLKKENNLISNLKKNENNLISYALFTNDSNLVIVADKCYSNITIWDFRKKNVIYQLPNQLKWPLCLNTAYASFYKQNEKNQIDLDINNQIQNLNKIFFHNLNVDIDLSKQQIKGICISPDNLHLAIAYNYFVVIWDMKNKKMLQTLKGHDQKITSIMYSKKRDCFITAGKDQSIRIYRIYRQSPQNKDNQQSFGNSKKKSYFLKAQKLNKENKSDNLEKDEKEKENKNLINQGEKITMDNFRQEFLDYLEKDIQQLEQDYYLLENIIHYFPISFNCQGVIFDENTNISKGNKIMLNQFQQQEQIILKKNF